MGREAIDLGQGGAGTLADEVDDRVTETEDPGRAALTAVTLSSPPGGASVTSVTEHTIELDGEPVFYRETAGSGTAVVFLHSVPTSSDDWLPFLGAGRALAPDLPGFGRSSKGGHLGYALADHARFVARLLDSVLPQETVALAGHGWGGAVALAYAQAHAGRVARLALIDPLPLFDGFTWPRPIRRLLTPGIGELVMGSVTRRRLGRALRAGAADPEAWTRDRVEPVWEQFDQGTQRAILRVARSVTPAGLAAAGAGLSALQVPALVLWGERDPWLPVAFADAYAERLASAEVVRVPRGGHWPWLEDPSVVERVTSFLAKVP